MKINISQSEVSHAIWARLKVGLPGLNRKTAQAVASLPTSPVIESF